MFYNIYKSFTVLQIFTRVSNALLFYKSFLLLKLFNRDTNTL